MATLLSVPVPRNKIARITKKNDRFNKQNNNSARPSDIFFLLLYCHNTTKEWNFFTQRLMENVNTKYKWRFVFSKHVCGHQEFNYEKFHL